jgi:hypothetical protein
MSSASGTFFHLSGWARIVGEVLGHRCFCLVACREHQITGVIPISWVRNRIIDHWPFTAAFGADNPDSYFSLLKVGNELAGRLGVEC